MKILALSSWFPYPPDNGSRQRAFYLLRELARRGHRIRLIARIPEKSLQGGVPEPLAELCAQVTTISPDPHRGSVSATVRAFLSSTPRAVASAQNAALTAAVAAELRLRPDIILAFERDIDASLPDFPFDIPAILDQVEFSGDWARRRQLTGIKSGLYWRRRLRRYRAITAVSSAEAAAARRILGDSCPQIAVIPNGADTRATLPRDTRKIIPGQLIYNGSPTYAPNRNAIHWFAHEILPRIVAQAPETRLIVTGVAACSRWGNALPPQALLTGYLPDLNSTLASSAICVVPLRQGGGTRLKILEAWAAGVPVISTTIGAAGLDAVSGEHLLIADTPETFAQAVIALLSDPERAARIAANARRFVETRYDWREIGASLDALLTEVVNP